MNSYPYIEIDYELYILNKISFGRRIYCFNIWALLILPCVVRIDLVGLPCSVYCEYFVGLPDRIDRNIPECSENDVIEKMFKTDKHFTNQIYCTLYTYNWKRREFQLIIKQISFLDPNERFLKMAWNATENKNSVSFQQYLYNVNYNGSILKVR